MRDLLCRAGIKWAETVTFSTQLADSLAIPRGTRSALVAFYAQQHQRLSRPHDITEHFPTSEQFGLTFQMRKAALGEHAELETQMPISDRRSYARPANRERLWSLSTEVGKLAHGLLNSLEALRPPEPIPPH